MKSRILVQLRLLVYLVEHATSHYSDDYIRLFKNSCFVDKTLFIKSFFELDYCKKLLISTPRGFGKTLTLQMLQLFVEIELDDYGIPKNHVDTTAYKLFANLSISGYPKIIEQHMAKYPVLYLDLKSSPELGTFDRNSIISFINTKLYDCFEKHSWMLQIPEQVLLTNYKISPLGVELMKKLRNRDLDNEDEPNDNVLYDLLLNLVIVLRSYYRRGVIILVDNYDDVVINSFQPSGNAVEMFYDHVNNVLQRAFESPSQDVSYGLLMATSGLILASIQAYLSDSQLHPFMGENSKFTVYFGFHETEVIHLLRLYNRSVSVNDLKSYYNGYKTIYQDLAIYNPTSVIRYLHNPRDLRAYWNITSADNFLVSFINDALTRTILENLVRNASTGYHMEEPYNGQNFQTFFEICETYKYNSTDQGLLLWYIYDQGYLSRRIVQVEPGKYLDAMGVPNEEMRLALNTLLSQTGPIHVH